VRLVRAEELVELRRRDAGAREHGVDLPAVMDLMLEQVRQKTREGLVLHAGATHHSGGAIEISVVKLSRNFGMEVAMSAGLDQARGQYVALMHADLQDPPELLPRC